MAVFFYGRYSNKDQDRYTKQAQFRARDAEIAAHAADGWVLGDTYFDEGKSAFHESLTRPDFQRLRADIESERIGRGDIVMVHKLDRFSRRTHVSLQVVNDLQARGIHFVSIKERFNL